MAKQTNNKSMFDGFLDNFGGMLAGAFGDKTAIAFLFSFLDDVSPGDCYQFIKKGEELFPTQSPTNPDGVSDEDWARYGNLARKANLSDVDTKRIIQEFRQYRPDLLSVILNQPGGVKWLDQQVAILRQKLGL